MGNKRIYILSEEEVKQLYDLPQFSCDEREIFFELNVKERRGLKNLEGSAAKIHFILQCGYFKAKQRIFEYSYSAGTVKLMELQVRYDLCH